MTTNQEWEERARSFYEVMCKLELDDLKHLAMTFKCYPHYAGEVTKELCADYLWTKLRRWRMGAERAEEMSSALRVLMPR